MLLVPDNKSEDDYKWWAEQIGMPSELGVHLQVGISYSDRPGPHVVAEGVVGVPRPPEDDFERQMLAHKIAGLVKSPDIAVFEFIGLLGWLLVQGGHFEIELTKLRKIRELDESEVSNSITLSGPGPLNEPVFRAKFTESDDWAREYATNRYLRFLNRAELNQRYQDLITNITILTDTGKLDLTDEKHWHRLFKHVVIEMFLRGEPPVHHNFDPSVAPAILFPDEELCTRAAEAIAEVRTQGACLVKYGKADHMRALYERGEVHMTLASGYSQPEHNQAVHDKELVSVYYGAIIDEKGYIKAREFHAKPALLGDPNHRFVPLFCTPDAAEDELTGIEFLGPDVWMYCMSELVTPRLFSDFYAEACVILDRDEFKARLRDAFQTLPGSVALVNRQVQYTDPVGAYGVPRRSPDVHFDKTFRFAYQCEYRFVIRPAQITENLISPLKLTLGPLNDLGELIVL